MWFISGVHWKDLLPPIMFCVVVRGSEDRRPSLNLFFFLGAILICYPSIVSAVLRPNKKTLQRLISGFPTMEEDDAEDEIVTAEEYEMEFEKRVDVGGGAINEKERKFRAPFLAESSDSGEAKDRDDNAAPSKPYNPSKYLAHLYHSLEGLDRYPNYLGRWNEDDMDSLEESLKAQLAKVREQKQAVALRRQGIKEIVHTLLTEDADKDRWNKLLKPCKSWDEVREKILDSSAAKAIFSSKMFKPRENGSVPCVEEVMCGNVKVELDASQLELLLDEELYDVFSFRLLKKEFCEELREFARAYWAMNEKLDEAKKQQIKGAFDFDLVGFKWLNDLLLHLVLRPVARQLYEDSEGLLEDLDWRHGYIAGYSVSPTEGKPRERLVTHTDDSDVTMNIGLGDKYEGGLIEFRGLRNTPEEGQLQGTFEPEIGVAVVHAGRHFHDVTQVESGDRYNYIMWARSWSGIRSERCPCCWLNRRDDNTCVCGPRWN